MGKAVQNALIGRQSGAKPTVELLIQEETGFLTVLHIHKISDSVLRDFRLGLPRVHQTGAAVPACPLRKPFPLPQRVVVSLIDAPNHLSVSGQRFDQQRVDQVLSLFHAVREALHRKQVGKAVHRQTREAVRFAETL